jgi:hypothetical protein
MQVAALYVPLVHTPFCEDISYNFKCRAEAVETLPQRSAMGHSLTIGEYEMLGQFSPHRFYSCPREDGNTLLFTNTIP